MFRYTFLALRKRWGVPGRYVSVGALPSNTMSGFCGHTMLQNDHSGKPLFIHQNLMKQIPSGVYKGEQRFLEKSFLQKPFFWEIFITPVIY